MIFTVGKTSWYEVFFEDQGSPMKAKGGSVWRTFEEAAKHASSDFSVYGVEAYWDSDTIQSTEGSWHDLVIAAPLFHLPNVSYVVSDEDKQKARTECYGSGESK